MTRLNKIMFCCLLLTLACFISLQPLGESKQVRVGYFLFDGFHEIYGNGHRNGYGYEYLQKLTEYVDWEYVYVQGTWQELLVMLEKGEIDLLTSATYTEQRAKIFDYSSLSMGAKHNCLFVNKNADIQYGDINYIQGQAVGFLEGNSENKTFASVCKDYKIDVMPHYFVDIDEMEQALQNGTIRAIVSSSLRHNKEEKILAQFYEKPFFGIVKKGNTPLLNELNYAMRQLKTESPNYEADLFEKYYERKQKIAEFTPDELSYLQKNRSLKVGYLQDLYPLEYYDKHDSTVKGIVPEIMKLVSFYSGISFDYVPYQDYNAMLEALKNKDIDLIARMPEIFSLAENFYALLSSPYIHLPNTIISKDKNNITSATKTAIPQNRNDLIYQAKKLYPTAQITTMPTWQDCIEALDDGKVDFLLQNTYITENILFSNGIHQARDWSIISDTNSPVCLAIGKHNDKSLLRILNKSLHQITVNEKNNIIMMNTKEPPLGFWGLLQKYYYQSAIAIAIIVIFVMAVILHFNRLNETLLEKMASVDHLTKIYNRTSITYEINKYLKEHPNSKNALFILDIDKFKVLNDSYGHPFGDQVLMLAASCLQNIFKHRALIGRLGGDEFVIFLKNITTINEVYTYAEIVNHSFLKIQNEHNHTITCSIGIAKTPEQGTDFSTLYHEADKALYIVKQSGRNSYYIVDLGANK